MYKLFFIRHGETTGDIENRYGGDYDDHLSDRGKQEAEDLAKKLVGQGIEIIFCSSLMRARETAEILGQTLSVDVVVEPKIKERNWYGKLTGMKKDEAKEKFPDQVELLKDRKNTPDGGEDYETFVARIRAGLEEVKAKTEHGIIAMVSHGGPMRVLFREILGKGEIDVEDCGFAEIGYDGQELTVIRTEGIKFVS